ncbi:MAG: endonuclease/exonuclease/phosphatase family protein, partial [Candidatus Binatia bacterium]
SYGNAILTRYPVLAIRQIDLSVPLREPRGAVAVDVGVRFGTLRVVGIHLGLQAAERRAQVERLLSELPAENVPLVVAGDFNEWLPGSTVIRKLRARFDRPPALRSFPSWRPLLPLDRIFAEPTAALREVVIHRSILSRVASDHLPVRASIRA